MYAVIPRTLSEDRNTVRSCYDRPKNRNILKENEKSSIFGHCVRLCTWLAKIPINCMTNFIYLLIAMYFAKMISVVSDYL